MRKKSLGWFVLAPIGLTWLLAWLYAVDGYAAPVLGAPQAPDLQATGPVATATSAFIPKTWTPTPHPTLLFNLPLVKQDAPRESKPEEGTKPTPPPPPTPTPIPPQTSAENAPIVVGALLIVSIIVLAWLFLDRKAWAEDRR